MNHVTISPMKHSKMRERIFKKARQLAKRNGVINLTRFELCKAVGVKPGSFSLIMGYGFPKFITLLLSTYPELKNQAVFAERVQVNGALRRDNILQIAMVIAVRKGYTDITYADLCDAAGISRPLIYTYFGNMKKVQSAVMGAAIEQGVLEILAQGLARRDPVARKAPKELREAALQKLMDA